ncbi:MAG: FAD-dependent oxidoreductase [Ardenticatenales bacterium]
MTPAPADADRDVDVRIEVHGPHDADVGADTDADVEAVDTADVVIIGAGPAGSALAALLARRGIDVVLLERDAFPRDKLCGEFLSPEAGRLLRTIGCYDALAALGPPALGAARFTLPSGFTLDVPLPGEGWGLSRSALDAVLAAHALTSGVRLLERTEAVAVRAAADGGVEVVVAAAGGASSSAASTDAATTDEASSTLGATVPPRGASPRAPHDSRVLRASLVVAAYGRWSRLDRANERPFAARRTPFIGLKRHMRVIEGDAGAATAAALAGRVEMHVFDGGYCGLTAIETGEVNACLLVHKRFVRGVGGAAWPSIVAGAGRANRTLGARLAGLAPVDDVVHAVAQVTFDFKDRGDADRLYVGDAAGMIAPLVGDGQAMALESAVRLADLIADALAQDGRPLDDVGRGRLAAAWDRAWWDAFGRRMHLARALQPVVLRPRLAEPAARVLAGLPGAMGWLARRTRG